MPKITIEHPTDPEIRAEAGWDHAIGWFCDIRMPGRRRHGYSAIENYNRGRPLWGLYGFLVAEGFFTEDQLTDALTVLQDGTVADEGAEVQRVAKIVAAVKRCGD